MDFKLQEKNIMNILEKLQLSKKLQKEFETDLKKSALWKKLYDAILERQVFPFEFNIQTIQNKEVYPYMSGSGGTYGHAIECKDSFFYEIYPFNNSHYHHSSVIRLCVEVGYIDSDDDRYYHEIHPQNRNMMLDFPTDLLLGFSEEGWNRWLDNRNVNVKKNLEQDIKQKEKSLVELKNTFDNL